MGIIITPLIKKYFDEGLEEGLKKGYSLTQILEELILPKHFIVGKNPDGTPRLVAPEFRPNQRQLEHHYYTKKTENISKYIKLRKGNKRFNLESRGIEGKSMIEADAPAAIYQIDSTPYPTILVSPLNSSWIIGTSYLYTVFDLFSQLLVGFYLSYKQDWASAMCALYCAFTNVRQFYMKFDFTNNESDFPAVGLCGRIVTDRGTEYTGYNSDNISNIGVHLTNVKAHRGDLKWLVENRFCTIQDDLISLQGTPRERNERPKREDKLKAIYTKNDLTQILINHFAFYNSNQILEKYPVSKNMISDGVLHTPLDIWNWGQSLGGPRDNFPDAAIKVNLLPQGSASVRENGIFWGKRRYISDSVKNSQMLVKARESGDFKIQVSIIPDNPSKIYLHLPNGKLEECPAADNEKAFFDCDWDEIDNYEKNKGAMVKKLVSHRQDGRAKLVEADKKVTKEAKKRAKNQKNFSNNERLSNTKINRKNEINREIEENIENENVANREKMDISKKNEGKHLYIKTDYSSEIQEVESKLRKM